jgi:DNA-binding CsgD family transcriptional regulator
VNARSSAPRERRYLHGISREQATRRPVSFQALLFFAGREPRYVFSPAEQELLLLAVRNHSDDECARELGISPETVKMRWRGIFERVAEAPPDGFPRPDVSESGKRGSEKRRHLLAYLAQHLEELRPRSR